ncbi:MAG: hypothetical protein AAGB51_10600 [Planctomycetota bacterium]
MDRRAWLVVVSGCAVVLGGCKSTGASSSRSDSVGTELRPVSAGLNDLLRETARPPVPVEPVGSDPRGTDLSDRIADQARAHADAQAQIAQLDRQRFEDDSPLAGAAPLDIRGVLDRAEEEVVIAPAATARESRPVETQAITSKPDSLAAHLKDDQPSVETEQVKEQEQSPEAFVVREPPTPEEAIDLLIAEALAAASAEADPQAMLARLAALEALRPGLLESAARSDPEVFGRLFDEQREALQAIASVVRAAADGEQGEALASRTRALAEALEGAGGFEITDAQLCTRVDGFGSYRPFDKNTFLAGRSQPAIVYTELDAFGHEQHADGWFEVRLSQSLELRHQADDLLAWRRPAETISDRSMRRVRDFYLINQIELPASLTVGRYRLKVITRDLVGGGRSERIIPLEIVADRALVGVTE